MVDNYVDEYINSGVTPPFIQKDFAEEFGITLWYLKTKMLDFLQKNENFDKLINGEQNKDIKTVFGEIFRKKGYSKLFNFDLINEKIINVSREKTGKEARLITTRNEWNTFIKQSNYKVRQFSRKSKIVIKCPLHGKFNMTPDHIDRGHWGCEPCRVSFLSKRMKEASSTENLRLNYKDIVEKASMNGLKVITNEEEFENQKKSAIENDVRLRKIQIRVKDSEGHIFEPKIRALFEEYVKCPYCKMSRGQKAVHLYLELIFNLKFDSEKYLSDVIPDEIFNRNKNIIKKKWGRVSNPRLLRYDCFSIVQFRKKKLFLAVEFNGEQHSHPLKEESTSKMQYASTLDEWKKIRDGDAVKRYLSKEAGIILIEFWWWQEPKNDYKNHLIKSFMKQADLNIENYFSIPDYSGAKVLRRKFLFPNDKENLDKFM